MSIELNFAENGIKSGVVAMSPALAEELLATSLGNRRINRQRVNAWAEDMQAGKWMVNGEPIIIDDQGHLREGHHRLRAVIRANTVVNMYVVTGVKEEDATIYDAGKPRSFIDISKMSGKNGLMTAGQIMAVVRYHFEVQKNVKTISFPTAEAFVERNYDRLETLYHISQVGGRMFTRKAPVEYAIFSALVNGESVSKAFAFAKSLNTGFYDSPQETAAIKLRNFLMTCTSTGALTYRAMCYTTENALRDYFAGRPRMQGYKQPCKPVYSNKPIMKLL